MTKVVTLRLTGNSEEVLYVNCQVTGAVIEAEINAYLPFNPQLLQALEDWKSSYISLDNPKRIRVNKNKPTNISLSEVKAHCQRSAQELEILFNGWLLREEFRPVRDKLLKITSLPEEEIRILIQADDVRLYELPWHRWQLIESSDNVEVALSTPNSQRIPSIQSTKDNGVKILAILGDSNGINIEHDRAILSAFKKQGAAVTFLDRPRQREINDRLWEQSWQILFFAGHSQTEDRRGRIYINEEDSLTVDELKHGLRKAIKKGLQLAIFNSCDGLGLAWQLQELHIPQVIVMSQPVPDVIAQNFLKYFLAAYAGGQSLYLSVKGARNKLHGDGTEKDYPCASWLPVIVSNVTATPPKWHDLRYGNLIAINRRREVLSVGASLITAAVIMGVRALGLLQGWELSFYDRFLESRPGEGPDHRLTIVEITEADIQYQRQKNMKGQWSLSDSALSLLLTRLQADGAKVIGLDLLRDYPSTNSTLARQLKTGNNFFAICRGSNLLTESQGTAPPPEMDDSQIGFSDVIKDEDDVLRRYLWIANFDRPSLCTSQESFPLLLSRYYWQLQGIKIQTNLSRYGAYLQVGKVNLMPLIYPAGGYQSLTEEDKKGYQMLINYRNLDNIAPKVKLSDVLEGKVDSNLFKGKIVLIGVTRVASPLDSFLTPVSGFPARKIYGVDVHAQIISQLLSAVADGRPFLSPCPFWVDYLWVSIWALIGGGLAWRCSRLPLFIIVTMSLVFFLIGLSFLLFLEGWWIGVVPASIAFVSSGSMTFLIRRNISSFG
ncbi:MAG: hypothetical protein N5P05_000999 [Chroococcopsis gigantea SAG 12.99]|jgi:CHASE2 domain-containing sensor protein|nr:CHASE2 domain-containing protein [Chlorogloea purpurea SAG 13.99]MDV2999393.1 hypothetical protein [Chroococcopsis gigantea SAG 12.99]